MAFDSKSALNHAIQYLTEAAQKRAAGGEVSDKARGYHERKQKLLQDQFPTHYMPNVGRQVMNKGGTADEDYRGSHEAPGPNSGAPLHDLTQVYPDDVYGPQGFQYYGYATGEPNDRENFNLITGYRGKPDAPVTIYRAVPDEQSVGKQIAKLENQIAAYRRRGKLPSDAWTTNGSHWYEVSTNELDKLREREKAAQPQQKLQINAGDWVTTNRKYAKDHGEGVLGGVYKILSKKVKAKELYTAGDSHQEWGYHPEKKEEMAFGGKVKKHPALSIAGVHIREEEHGEPTFIGER